ncbi:hypothetical protein PIROE2DRAFT_16538 [Piromyces sp. E2]|nr:hypothetical protein PIROE2DRAFT_16538 [Piromyces sp. E2]|eukprot:OUM58246.1 hypothetical protein PIROE2DRAFT_16538 [Piromyces sp. E2]
MITPSGHHESTNYFELVQNNNSNEKYILKSCFDFDNSKNKSEHDSDSVSVNDKDQPTVKNTCTVSVCSSDGECLSNECVSGHCPMNLDTPTFYCNAGTTEYKCRKLTGDTSCQNNDMDCSTSRDANEFKYIYISAITITAIVILAVAINLYYKKSKPIDESNIKNVSSVILK